MAPSIMRLSECHRLFQHSKNLLFALLKALICIWECYKRATLYIFHPHSLLPVSLLISMPSRILLFMVHSISLLFATIYPVKSFSCWFCAGIPPSERCFLILWPFMMIVFDYVGMEINFLRNALLQNSRPSMPVFHRARSKYINEKHVKCKKITDIAHRKCLISLFVSPMRSSSRCCDLRLWLLFIQFKTFLLFSSKRLYHSSDTFLY